jgi:hypothetical protein
MAPLKLADFNLSNLSLRLGRQRVSGQSKSAKDMSSLPDNSSYVLTKEQKAHFLEHGFIKVEKCFSRAQAAEFTSKLWTRLGYDPDDKSTWAEERTNMPYHHHAHVPEFSPKAWSAMCQLLGGEDRISPHMSGWSDGFIVNLGRKEYNPDDELKFRGVYFRTLFVSKASCEAF